MTLHRLALAAVASLLLAPFGAGAQGYPNRPITLIVPWPAGGSTDTHLRKLAEIAGKHLGQSIIVENRPGAGGMLGPAKKAIDDPEHHKVLAQLDQVYWYQSTADYARWAAETFVSERSTIERLGLLAK